MYKRKELEQNLSSGWGGFSLLCGGDLRTEENVGHRCELARREAWQGVQGLRASDEHFARCRAVGRVS